MIRKLSALVPALTLTATPLLAQNGESSPLDVNVGLMIWTVLIFVLVLVALAKFAWPNSSACRSRWYRSHPGVPRRLFDGERTSMQVTSRCSSSAS